MPYAADLLPPSARRRSPSSGRIASLQGQSAAATAAAVWPAANIASLPCVVYAAGKAMAAAARRCARSSVPSMSFECGSVTPSRVKLARCKCRVSSERAVLQKEIRERNRSIRDREFVSFLSSFKVQASKRLAYDMDEQWPHHCSSDRVPLSSAQPSSYKSDMMKQVQGHQPHLPLDLENNVNPTGLSEKEIERRRKIGAANKGKAPWTKGRKLSKEHKQLIKQRTIEALRDPKVMSC